jgi:hydrogenase-4 component F
MNLVAAISILPIVATITTLITRSAVTNRVLVPIFCSLQFASILCWSLPIFRGGSSTLSPMSDFSVTKLGVCFLLLTTFVVACSLTHAGTFFAAESRQNSSYRADQEQFFYASSTLCLLAMSFIFVCDNLGYLWISIEATTLCSASLVYYSRTKHALEATWKYLIVCSVGIAFALLGTVLIFAASQHGACNGGSLNIQVLLSHAELLQPNLLKLGYIFCLLGFGTKAGIFPLHSWLPDAHSEAPAPASAILSGALLNCALFAIYRIAGLMGLTHHCALSSTLPIYWGALTALAASLFLIHQSGIKRLWAYSSIENVGIMLVAIGLDSPLLFFLQALNHSLAKVGLFLLSGNIIQALGTKDLSQIRGVLTTSPTWGILLAVSAIAVTGSPPFGAFLSEWLILTKCTDSRHWLAALILLVAIALSFVAVCIHASRILLGPARTDSTSFRPLLASIVPAVLCVGVTASGLTTLPSFLQNLL